jgi:hypothetical protein
MLDFLFFLPQLLASEHSLIKNLMRNDALAESRGSP